MLDNIRWNDGTMVVVLCVESPFCRGLDEILDVYFCSQHNQNISVPNQYREVDFSADQDIWVCLLLGSSRPTPHEVEMERMEDDNLSQMT